jgi:peptide/nickel transport system permease protein
MVIMRICDLFLCIPGILMALALVAALGPGRKNLLIAIGISSIPGVTRQFRALMLNVISNDYITAARAAGARDGYIIIKHVLPNVMAYIVLTAASSISGMIMQISGLSYIGMGIQHPEPEWGAMLSDARGFLADGPHLMIIPAVTILLVSLAFNLLGDALRDALDPRLKSE